MRALLHAALVAALLLLTPGSGTGVAKAQPVPTIVLGDDDGGGIDDHLKWYKRLAEAGVPVKVDGLCVSACTLVLILPPEQVCVTTRSAFGFHLASAGNTPLPDFTSILIRRYYPPQVREWIDGWVAKHGALTRERIAYMQADEIIDRGVFRDCGGEY